MKPFPFDHFLNIPEAGNRRRSVRTWANGAVAMYLHGKLRNLSRAALALLLPLCLALVAPAQAQDTGFGAAARVNNQVITRFELDQRIRMMEVFRQTGDIPKLALQSLIDDALRRGAARARDITVSPDEIQAGMTEFASRANLPLDKFLEELDKADLAPETLRDFVEAGLLWRNVVRDRFAGKIRITPSEIDRAIGEGAASGGGLRLLLSELVLPLGGDVDAQALATRLKQTITSAKAFSMAAQDFSKADTARSGGQLGWIDASALPPELAPSLLALKVGEMTEPMVMEETVRLYFLRDVSQGKGDAPGATQVDYIRFFAPAGMDLDKLVPGLDTCDDVWGLARGLPADAVQRASFAEAGLPPDLRAALAGLDAGEARVIPGPGAARSLVMLCSRAPASLVPPSRDDVQANLLNAKLGLLATAYLEELRSNAFIRIE